MGKSSLEVSFQRVIEQLEHMSKEVIKWPSGSQQSDIISGFEKHSGFPGTTGAIDGTHIYIKAPTEYGDTYINRKKRHSIVLQAVCDHNMSFIDCFAGYPGSVHDARVLRNSPLYSDAQLDCAKWFPGNSHLLGDAAYPIKKWLMVPFRDNGHLSAKQKVFNTKLSSTRCVVERSFALLKGRFRRLKMLEMNRTDLIPQCILACCVLHNICIQENDEMPDDGNNVNSNGSDDSDIRLQDNTGNHTLAVQKRIEIMNSF